MAATSITIAILAGGAALRLDGRDKGLEPVDGRPLIAWVVEAIRRMDEKWADATGGGAVDFSVLIVANRHVEVYSRHAKTIGDDEQAFRGPLAGIASALAFCATPWLITLPVDCPQPPRDLAARLFGAAHANAWDAVVAHDGDRRQPLFAIYRRELASSAAKAVAAGHGVWSWQEAIGAIELDFSDRRRQFCNLNTPEEFAAHAHRDET